MIRAQPVVRGAAAGELLVSSEPLSFWGGYDPQSGEIIDRRHPLSGQSAAGRILVVPFSRGSSTTTAILLEAVRLDRAPVAILTTGKDTFFALTSIVAAELYGRSLPILSIATEDLALLMSGQRATISEDGAIILEDQDGTMAVNSAGRREGRS
jgi:predicted aconitase with swiveling domain